MPRSAILTCFLLILLPYQGFASIGSLIKAVQNMKTTAERIQNPQALRKEREVLQRFATADRPVVLKAIPGTKNVSRQISKVVKEVMKKEVEKVRSDMSDIINRTLQKQLKKETKKGGTIMTEQVKKTIKDEVKKEIEKKQEAEKDQIKRSVQKEALKAVMIVRKAITAKIRSTAQDEVKKAMRNVHDAMEVKIGKTVRDELKRSLTDRSVGPTSWCLPPWHRARSDICIFVSHDTASWEDANTACQVFNSTLAAFRDIEDYRAVVHSQVILSCPWIGLRKTEKGLQLVGPKTFEFTLNLLLKLALISATSDEENHCITSCVSGMNVRTCSEKLKFICMKIPPKDE